MNYVDKLYEIKKNLEYPSKLLFNYDTKFEETELSVAQQLFVIEKLLNFPKHHKIVIPCHEELKKLLKIKVS